MKIFLVYMGDILHCPPAMSMIQVLDDLGHDVYVCMDKLGKGNYDNYFSVSERVKFVEVGQPFKSDKSLIHKMIDMFLTRKRIWNFYYSEKNEDSLIWVLSSGSIKYLGKKLLKEKYILHLLELTEELYLLESKHFIKLSRKYAQKAKAVIECEYNRAHITKAWWELDKLPYIIANKPYTMIDIRKKADITSREEVKALITNLESKRIILYQGNMSRERPLDKFIEAVNELGDPYVFVAMTNSEDPYPELHTGNYFHIPFVEPPFHLEVTSHAYIGILSYVPIKNDYSILNTLYCAPNKIWEYAKYGIPMIGNDLPALRFQFTLDKNGICLSSMKKDEIIAAIKEIADNYDTYSKSALDYFKSYDLKKEVEYVLSNLYVLK